MKSDMKKLEELATLQQLAAEDVEKAEEHLSKCKKAYADIAENQLPELMNNLRITEFTTEAGLKIAIKSTVHANIAKDRLPEAVKWLRKHGHEKLIKHTFTVVSTDDKEAQKLEKVLGKYEGMSAAPKVHPSTLRAWAKEMLDTGADIDLKLFGVHVRDVAVVKS